MVLLMPYPDQEPHTACMVLWLSEVWFYLQQNAHSCTSLASRMLNHNAQHAAGHNAGHQQPVIKSSYQPATRSLPCLQPMTQSDTATRRQLLLGSLLGAWVLAPQAVAQAETLVAPQQAPAALETFAVPVINTRGPFSAGWVGCSRHVIEQQTPNSVNANMQSLSLSWSAQAP